MSWQFLGETVRRARNHRRQTQAAFAREVGVSVRLLGSLEAGEARRYDATTVDRLESALGWAPGSFDRVVNGQPPVVLVDEQLARIVDAWPRLPAEVRRMLSTLAGDALSGD